MRIIDLSHEIHPTIPVYPGTEPPQLTAATTIAKDGFAETLLSMYSHTGTHMDAPAHIFAEGRSLERFAADHFFGPACLVDVSELAGRALRVSDLQPAAAVLATRDFLLLKTGWAARWGEESYFSGYPYLSAEAAEWLSGFSLKGVGIDAISVDPVEDHTLSAHQRLLGREILIIENLTGLQEISSKHFYFSCLPLKLRHADGSPIRAVAIEGFGPQK